jgi:D-glycero-D-manno-heptose 1,7-bisphosphate phosphatase
MTSPALFLDRDGVINVDRGYVHLPEHFEFIPGVFEIARFAVHELGWPVVVVTNQAGIGRGYYDEATYQALTRWMCDQFSRANAPIARVYHCPYHPEHGVGAYRLDHPWRKPRPGMILQAASDLDLNLAASALIGDALSDMQAGAAAGVGLLIKIGGTASVPPGDYEAVADHAEALALLRRATGPSRPLVIDDGRAVGVEAYRDDDGGRQR